MCIRDRSKYRAGMLFRLADFYLLYAEASVSYTHLDVYKRQHYHWTVTANTEEKTGEVSAAYPHNGQTISLIDGEINTFWHSQWQGGEVAPPYEIILDMGKENSVSQLGLIARQNALTSMNLEIYAGDDGETWNLIGKYFFDGSIKTEQMVPVKACDARWIRLYIPTLGSGSSVGHLAEIYVYGTDK